MSCGPGDGVAQFDVYLNPSPRSREEIPFVVDIQSDLLADLHTRLVVPLSRTGVHLTQAPRRLVPLFTIEGEPLALQPHLAAAMDVRLLRRPVASLAGHDGEVRDALGAVLSGI